MSSGTCAKTYETTVWNVLDVLAQQLHFIDLGQRFHSPARGLSYLTVDTTLCPIEIHRVHWNEQFRWYDAHRHKHGFKYEAAVHATTGEIHWWTGGFVGSEHDLTVLRNGGLLQYLTPGEHMLGDKAYIGEPVMLCPYRGRPRNLTPAQNVWNTWMAQNRVKVENSINRIKAFDILRRPYRHTIASHSTVFAVCTQTAALDLRVHPTRAGAPLNPYVQAANPGSYAIDDSDPNL